MRARTSVSEISACKFFRRALCAAGAALAFATGAFAGSGEPTVEMRFEKLNGTYSDFVGELAPIGDAGLSVTLQSPHQTLTLRDHRVRLTPLSRSAGGRFAGEVELDVQGKGELVADVTIGPIVRHLTDVVVVPPQTLRLAATVVIRRVSGGYEITPENLPPRIEVAVQSQTINQILALCDQASSLSLGAIDCSGLDGALTRPAVPIPGGTGGFLLDDDRLTDADRIWLDTLLGTPAAED